MTVTALRDWVSLSAALSLSVGSVSLMLFESLGVEASYAYSAFLVILSAGLLRRASVSRDSAWWFSLAAFAIFVIGFVVVTHDSTVVPSRTRVVLVVGTLSLLLSYLLATR